MDFLPHPLLCENRNSDPVILIPEIITYPPPPPVYIRRIAIPTNVGGSGVGPLEEGAVGKKVKEIYSIRIFSPKFENSTKLSLLCGHTYRLEVYIGRNFQAGLGRTFNFPRFIGRPDLFKNQLYQNS